MTHLLHLPSSSLKLWGGGRKTPKLANECLFDTSLTSSPSPDFAIFPEDLLLQEDLIELLPMVNEANAMSEEMDKKVKYELALISPQARGLKDGRTEVCLCLVQGI